MQLAVEGPTIEKLVKEVNQVAVQGIIELEALW